MKPGDEHLVKSAEEKLAAGTKLTSREQQAYARYEKQQLLLWGPKYCAQLSKSEFVAHIDMRSQEVLRLAVQYELPYERASKTVDILAMVKAWFDWEKKHRQQLRALTEIETTAEALGDEQGIQFWQKELVRERTLRERDGRAEREKGLLPVEIIMRFLQEFYVLPMRRRIEQLEQRGDRVSEGLADDLRQDIDDFRNAAETIFDQAAESEDSNGQVPKRRGRPAGSPNRKTKRGTRKGSG